MTRIRGSVPVCRNLALPVSASTVAVTGSWSYTPIRLLRAEGVVAKFAGNF